MKRSWLSVVLLVSLAPSAGAVGPLPGGQAAVTNALHDASGTFEVKLTPSTPAPGADGRTLTKTYHGALDGTGDGLMLSAGDPASGNAGYVAMERVTGKLDGKTGTFALMQSATMSSGSTPQLTVMVVPGSGTGELSGLYGTMTIAISAEGGHIYTLRYGFASK